MSTFESVRQVIAEELSVAVTPSTKLIDIADSLERVALVLELEQEFGRDIPDDDVRKLFTVQDIVTYIDSPSH